MGFNLSKNKIKVFQSEEIASNEFELNEWKQIIKNFQENKSLEESVLKLKRTRFKHIEDLVSFLSLINYKNDFEKAWAIYLWIADNIEFNMDTYKKSGANDPKTVFKTGHCICEGYARLYALLCQGLNLECIQISGYSKGADYKIGQKFELEDHAWASFKADNKWWLVEPTWGSCSSITHLKERNPYWFMTPPQFIIFDHFSPQFQLQKKKINLKEFQTMPMLKLEFHLYGIECLTYKTAIISTTSNPLFIEFSAPKEILLMGILKKNDLTIDNAIIIQRDLKSLKYGIFILIPEKNIDFKLIILAKINDTNLNFIEVAAFQVNRITDVKSDRVYKYSLGYNYDIKCLSHYSSVITTSLTPFLIEFSAPEDILIIANLYEEQNGLFNKEIHNSLMIQQEAVTLNFGVIVLIPKLNKYYMLNIFAKKHDDPGLFNLIGSFLLTRNGDDINENVNKYPIVFDYDLKCLTDSSMLIKSSTNPIFIEFSAPLDTLLKASLTFDDKLQEAVIIQRDTISLKYGLFVQIPELHQLYKLELFAKKCDENDYERLPFFLIDKIGNELNDVYPNYLIEFNYDLKLKSHSSLSILSAHDILFIEFSSPKETLIISDLKMNTNGIFDKLVDNSILIQRDAKTFKYGLFVLIKEKFTLYKLTLYAKYASNPSQTYTYVASLMLNRIGDKLITEFPKYFLEYDYCLKLLSHFSQFIISNENPIRLEFSAPETTLISTELKDSNGNELLNNVLIQRSPDKHNYELKIILTDKNCLYDLKLFAKNSQNINPIYDFITGFKLKTTQEYNENTFVKLYYSENIQYYIFSPIVLNLKANTIHSFKYYVKNAIKVALCDEKSNYFYLEQKEQFMWTTDITFDENLLGEVRLYVKNEEDNSEFKALCSYFIVI
jgi:hypothetical protein